MKRATLVLNCLLIVSVVATLVPSWASGHGFDVGDWINAVFAAALLAVPAIAALVSVRMQRVPMYTAASVVSLVWLGAFALPIALSIVAGGTDWRLVRAVLLAGSPLLLACSFNLYALPRLRRIARMQAISTEREILRTQYVVTPTRAIGEQAAQSAAWEL